MVTIGGLSVLELYMLVALQRLKSTGKATASFAMVFAEYSYLMKMKSDLVDRCDQPQLMGWVLLIVNCDLNIISTYFMMGSFPASA